MDRNIEYNIEGYVPGLQFTEYVFDIVRCVSSQTHSYGHWTFEIYNYTGFFYDEIKKFITL